MHKLSYGRKFKFGISESPHILNSTGQSERGALMKAMKKKRDNVLCILKVIAKEISYFQGVIYNSEKAVFDIKGQFQMEDRE